MSEFLWAALATTVGVFMHVSARARSSNVVYRLMHARAKVLWGHERAHGFLATSGVLVSSYALVWGLGWLPMVGEWYVEAVAEPLYAVVAGVVAAATIHTTSSAAMGLSPLRTVRWATSQGEESRDRIMSVIVATPMHFQGLLRELNMGKGQLRRHLDVLIADGEVVESSDGNRRVFARTGADETVRSQD